MGEQNKLDGPAEDEQEPMLGINSTAGKYATYNSTIQTKNQQNGDENQGRVHLPMVLLYRGIFIQLLFVLPVGIWWISGIRPILLALGQNLIISEMTTVSFSPYEPIK